MQHHKLTASQHRSIYLSSIHTIKQVMIPIDLRPPSINLLDLHVFPTYLAAWTACLDSVFAKLNTCFFFDIPFEGQRLTECFPFLSLKTCIQLFQSPNLLLLHSFSPSILMSSTSTPFPFHTLYLLGLSLLGLFSSTAFLFYTLSLLYPFASTPFNFSRLTLFSSTPSRVRY